MQIQKCLINKKHKLFEEKKYVYHVCGILEDLRSLKTVPIVNGMIINSSSHLNVDQCWLMLVNIAYPINSQDTKNITRRIAGDFSCSEKSGCSELRVCQSPCHSVSHLLLGGDGMIEISNTQR